MSVLAMKNLESVLIRPPLQNVSRTRKMPRDETNHGQDNNRQQEYLESSIHGAL
jgi:hypothetical protein